MSAQANNLLSNANKLGEEANNFSQQALNFSEKSYDILYNITFKQFYDAKMRDAQVIAEIPDLNDRIDAAQKFQDIVAEWKMKGIADYLDGVIERAKELQQDIVEEEERKLREAQRIAEENERMRARARVNAASRICFDTACSEWIDP